MMKYFALKMIYIILFVYCSFGSSASTTYVYCVNQQEKWFWLKNVNGDYYQIDGSWHVSTYHKNFKKLEFHYFIPFCPVQKIGELTQLCQKQFGEEYRIPQPANTAYSSWSLLAYDSDTFVNGFVDVYIVSEEEYYKDHFGYKIRYRGIKNRPESNIIKSKKMIFDFNLFTGYHK